ncbi:MAG TPA: GGDEF domain-containing protein [Bryobacteraceae bacterium]|jgi:diguanylate cyclase (GGDEF)-like protein|nr:GGDEF domain-containing protein [Bryobacteraceae bacterium]
MSSPEKQSQLESAAALDCYLASILDIAETVASLCGEIGASCHDQLVRLRSRVAYHASLQTLEESRNALHSELIDFSEKARQYNNVLAEDVAKALALLSQNESAVAVRNEKYIQRLARFVDQMEQVAQSGDRALAAGQAVELRGFVESMEQDGRAANAQLQAKLAEFQDKLREVEFLASIDPLTGIPNRREFNRQLEARVAANREFCVLLFDLNTFQRINYDHGHLCGDEILKQLGNRLSTHVRPRDFVCRWGGDEFVVILECPLAIAEVRAEEISHLLSGPYEVMLEGQEITVKIGVSFGVSERSPGETAEQVFHRADEGMYRQKPAPTRINQKSETRNQ